MQSKGDRRDALDTTLFVEVHKFKVVRRATSHRESARLRPPQQAMGRAR
jgi:hypothetical protein